MRALRWYVITLLVLTLTSCYELYVVDSSSSSEGSGPSNGALSIDATVSTAILTTNKSSYLVTGTCDYWGDWLYVVLGNITKKIECTTQNKFSVTINASALTDGNLTLTATQVFEHGDEHQVTLNIIKDTDMAPFNVTGAPTGASNELLPTITVSGTDVVKYQYKYGDSSISCNSTSGYSSDTSPLLNPSVVLSSVADGGIKLCVKGFDANGNFLIVTNAWTKDTVVNTPTVTGVSDNVSYNQTTNICFDFAENITDIVEGSFSVSNGTVVAASFSESSGNYCVDVQAAVLGAVGVSLVSGLHDDAGNVSDAFSYTYAWSSRATNLAWVAPVSNDLSVTWTPAVNTVSETIRLYNDSGCSNQIASISVDSSGAESLGYYAGKYFTFKIESTISGVTSPSLSVCSNARTIMDVAYNLSWAGSSPSYTNTPSLNASFYFTVLNFRKDLLFYTDSACVNELPNYRIIGARGAGSNSALFTTVTLPYVNGTYYFAVRAYDSNTGLYYSSSCSSGRTIDDSQKPLNLRYQESSPTNANPVNTQWDPPLVGSPTEYYLYLFKDTCTGKSSDSISNVAGITGTTYPLNVWTDGVYYFGVQAFQSGVGFTSGIVCSPPIVIDTHAPVYWTRSNNMFLADNLSNFTVDFVFNEDVVGFSAADLTATNGSISNFTQTDARHFQITVTPTNKIVKIDFTGSATDSLGNAVDNVSLQYEYRFTRPLRQSQAAWAGSANERPALIDVDSSGIHLLGKEGVYRSTDGGSTFLKVTTSSNFEFIPNLDPNYKYPIVKQGNIIALSIPSGALLSNDNGITFQKMPATPWSDLQGQSNIFYSSNGFQTIYGSDLVKYNSVSHTFEVEYGGLVSFADDETIYKFNAGNIQRTDASGTTTNIGSYWSMGNFTARGKIALWTNGADPRCNASIDDNLVSGIFNCTGGTTYTDGTNSFFLQWGKVFYSVNKNLSFTEIAAPTNCNQIAFYSNYLYLNCGDGLYRTDINSISWSKLIAYNSVVDFYDPAAIDGFDNHWIWSTYDSLIGWGIFRTDDNFLTRSTIVPFAQAIELRYEYNTVTPASSTIIYRTDNTTFNISYDNGTSFTAVTSSSGFSGNIYETKIHNGNIYVATSVAVYISTDGGSSFSNFANVASTGIPKMEMLSNDDFYIMNGSNLYYAPDAGALTSMAADSYSAFNERVIVANTTNSNFYASTDGGLSFSTINFSSFGFTPYGLLSFGSNSTAVRATDGNLYISLDNDVTQWHRLSRLQLNNMYYFAPPYLNMSHISSKKSGNKYRIMSTPNGYYQIDDSF